MRSPSKASEALACVVWACGDLAWSLDAHPALPCLLMMVAGAVFLIVEDQVVAKVATFCWCLANALWCAHDLGAMSSNWSYLPLVVSIVAMVVYAGLKSDCT